MKRNKKECDICKRLISFSGFSKHVKAHKNNKSIINKIQIKVLIEWLQENGKYKCPECEKEYSKKGIATHIWRNHTEEGKKFTITHNPNIGYLNGTRVAWNKGLTRKTDERVNRLHVNRAKNITSGKTIIKGHSHTNNTKEKLSLKRSKIIEENGGGGFAHIKWYNVKNNDGENFIVRGTWELKTAFFLNNSDILWKRKVYINYVDMSGIKRTYCPDFFLPEYNLYLEIKGYFSPTDQEKIQMVRKQNKINLELLTKKELIELQIL